jgi:hypothetical protein
MKRLNNTTAVYLPTIVNRKEDTASEDSTPSDVYLELKKQKKEVREGTFLSNHTNPVGDNQQKSDAATNKVTPKSPTKKLDTPITFSSKKKQYVTKAYTVGAAFNLLILRFKHGTNFNEDGFIKPFKDYLDTPKGAELASDLRILQVCNPLCTKFVF